MCTIPVTFTTAHNLLVVAAAMCQCGVGAEITAKNRVTDMSKVVINNELPAPTFSGDRLP
jgi:hypothetical protein